MATGFMKREGIMLAYPAEEKRIKAFTSVVEEDGTRAVKMFHQPKLNGERARIEWFKDIPYLISSYGNQFSFMDNIQKQLVLLAEVTGKQLKHDGEVYVHGWSRERIDSALRRTKNRNPDVDLLEYHIFDEQNEKLQYERISDLGLLDQTLYKMQLPNIKVVPYGICSDTEWLGHCGNYCEEGYEGIILRELFAGYEEKRTPWLLKFKPKETDVYRIVAVNEAFTSDTKIAKGMVGSFTVAAKDEPGASVVFDVGAGKLPHNKRIEYWNIRESLLGKDLLVKHELLRTTNQVPIAAVTMDVIW